MAGLLDISEDQLLGGLLGAGAASGARGNFLSRMAAGLQAGDRFRQGRQEQARQRSQEEMKAEFLKLQMLKAQRDAEREQAAAAQQSTNTSALRSALMPTSGIDALSGGGGPTPENAARIGQQQPFDVRQFIAKNPGVDLAGIEQYMKLDKAMNPAAETKVLKPGDIIGTMGKGGAFNQTFAAPERPDKPAALPSAIQEYEYAKKQGYQGTFDQWNKETKRAGASSVSVNTEKPLLNSIASGLGKQIDDSFSNAKGAVSSIGTAQRLRSAVDSGKLVSGPGASFRVLGLQLGQMLGVGGKDGAEILSNTRTAIQSMAQAELDAAQQMKGQGQITEAERGIIKRAAAGDINDLTGPEIGLLANTMEKIGRYKLKNHQGNVQALGKMPGAAALMPFYQIEAPAEYQAPASAPGRVRKFNPATGKIE